LKTCPLTTIRDPGSESGAIVIFDPGRLARSRRRYLPRLPSDPIAAAAKIALSTLLVIRIASSRI
jgi:hypothetical protein